jgi:hypothetical protein
MAEGLASARARAARLLRARRREPNGCPGPPRPSRARGPAGPRRIIRWLAPRAVGARAVGRGRRLRTDAAAGRRPRRRRHAPELPRAHGSRGAPLAPRGPYHRAILRLEASAFGPAGHRQVLAVSARAAAEVASDYAVRASGSRSSTTGSTSNASIPRVAPRSVRRRGARSASRTARASAPRSAAASRGRGSISSSGSGASGRRATPCSSSSATTSAWRAGGARRTASADASS